MPSLNLSCFILSLSRAIVRAILLARCDSPTHRARMFPALRLCDPFRFSLCFSLCTPSGIVAFLCFCSLYPRLLSSRFCFNLHSLLTFSAYYLAASDCLPASRCYLSADSTPDSCASLKLFVTVNILEGRQHLSDLLPRVVFGVSRWLRLFRQSPNMPALVSDLVDHRHGAPDRFGYLLRRLPCLEQCADALAYFLSLACCHLVSPLPLWCRCYIGVLCAPSVLFHVPLAFLCFCHAGRCAPCRSS